jgi:hypothetical protein
VRFRNMKNNSEVRVVGECDGDDNVVREVQDNG